MSQEKEKVYRKTYNSEYHRKRYAANPQHHRDRWIFCKYGLTRAAFDAMLAGQGDKCAIFGTDSWTKHGPVVDHCHETKGVRGILCNRCNVAIGNLRDSPDLARAAAAYLDA